MALTYTTTEAIERRLTGWLSVSQPATTFGESKIDPALVEQIAGQSEARVNQVLRDRYQLPLSGTHAELASVVEQLTVCQIIGQMFAGNGGDPSQSGGYGAQMCRQGEKELRALNQLDLMNECPTGAEVSTPASGARSLPGMYKSPTQTKTDVIRW